MKDPFTYCAQSLGEWLVLATDGLVAPARERIGLEIEAHYADAVKSGMVQGLNQEDAEGAALFGLGDPKAAAKGFRKRHLTEDEEKWLRKWVEESRAASRSRWYWRHHLGILLVVVLLYWSGSRHPGLSYLVLGLGAYCASAVVRLKFRSLLKESFFEYGFARKLLFLHLLTAALLLLFFSIIVPTKWETCVFFVLLFLVNFEIVNPQIILWCKLRHSQSGNGKGLAT